MQVPSLTQQACETSTPHVKSTICTCNQHFADYISHFLRYIAQCLHYVSHFLRYNIILLAANPHLFGHFGDLMLTLVILEERKAGRVCVVEFACCCVSHFLRYVSHFLRYISRFLRGTLGMNLNRGDYDGRTPLQLAAAEGHGPTLFYLLYAGANPNCMVRQTFKKSW